jgi:hypothetical protein
MNQGEAYWIVLLAWLEEKETDLAIFQLSIGKMSDWGERWCLVHSSAV